MRILIADDDPITLSLLEMMLDRLGHESVKAHDGEQAWEIMRAEEAPALAILDWMMPGLDGTDVCRKVREQVGRPYAYLIMLTAKEAVEDVVEGMQSGADDYLRKPFDPRELRARLAAGERVLALQDHLRARAMFDELTGLPNRATIVEQLAREIAHAARRNDGVSIVLADLDEFKLVNDTHGHLVGDEVLREASKRLTGSVRPYDVFGRYGGEEFLAVLPGCDLPSAMTVAERMRRSLANAAFETSAGPILVTSSFGVATLRGPAPVQIDHLLAEADAALYRAKRAGRDRIESALPSTSSGFVEAAERAA